MTFIPRYMDLITKSTAVPESISVYKTIRSSPLAFLTGLTLQLLLGSNLTVGVTHSLMLSRSYVNYLVDRLGVEPRPTPCKGVVLPLSLSARKNWYRQGDLNPMKTEHHARADISNPIFPKNFRAL